MSNNPTKYGPWAGKLLTGDDYSGTIYAVSTNGSLTPYNLGIAPDTIMLVPPTNDLYCVYFAQDQSMILKVSQKWLTNYVGDILMVQAGENRPQDPLLFIVYWNGSTYDIHSIALKDDARFRTGVFEKATFAPITLPTISP